jgi:hypothetical protein
MPRSYKISDAERIARAERLRLQLADPKFKAAQTESLMRLHADPEYRNAQAERMRQRQADPEFSKANAERWQQRTADPEFRKKQSAAASETMSRLHANPEFKKRHALAVREGIQKSRDNNSNDGTNKPLAKASKPSRAPKAPRVVPTRPDAGQKISYPVLFYATLVHNHRAIRAIFDFHDLIILHLLAQKPVPLTPIKICTGDITCLHFIGSEGKRRDVKSYERFPSDQRLKKLIELNLIQKAGTRYKLNDKALVADILAQAKASVAGVSSAPSAQPA